MKTSFIILIILFILLLAVKVLAFSIINQEKIEVSKVMENNVNMKQRALQLKELPNPSECDGKKCATATMVVEANIIGFGKG